MAHHLFSIPELCAAIIEFVIVEPGRIEDDYEYWMPMDPASSPTLAPLASVSSIFKEPALDALWRRLKDIYPLARLLPRDVVCLKDGIWKLVGNHDIEVLASTIDSDTRMLVLGYARRVRRIQRPIQRQVSHNVVKLLVALGAPTFPFLDSLAIAPKSIEELHLIKLFLYPSLVRVILDLTSVSAFEPLFVAAVDVVDNLPQKCPSMEALAISDGSQVGMANSLNRSLARALPNLRLSKFEMPNSPIKPDTFIALRSATLIQEIDIHLGKDFEIPADKDIFPALQNLSLYGPSQSCVDFTTSLRPTAIVRPPFTLSLSLSDEPPKRLMHLIGDALGASLRELTIIFSAPPLESPILSPLLECSNLQRLSIRIRMDDIEDDQIYWGLLDSARRAWIEFYRD